MRLAGSFGVSALEVYLVGRGKAAGFTTLLLVMAGILVVPTVLFRSRR